MKRIGHKEIKESQALRSLVERMKGLSPDEIDRRLTSPEEGELSDQELALVSGGYYSKWDDVEVYCGECGAGPMSMGGWVGHYSAYHD